MAIMASADLNCSVAQPLSFLGERLHSRPGPGATDEQRRLYASRRAA
jgi:hypothetical protein